MKDYESDIALFSRISTKQSLKTSTAVNTFVVASAASVITPLTHIQKLFTHKTQKNVPMTVLKIIQH